MELPFGLRQLKQEVSDVPYPDHLLFVIRELMSFTLQRHFVVTLIKTSQVPFRVASFLAQDGAIFKEVHVEISPSTNCLLLLSVRPQECMEGYTMNTHVYDM